MLVLLCLSLLGIANGAVLEDVYPRRGSTMGGTELTLYGSGFAPTVEADVRVFVGSQPCNIIEYYSSDTRLVCMTPYFGYESVHTVTVSIVGLDKDLLLRTSSYSRGQFRSEWDDTPTVSKQTAAAFAGSQLRLYGYLRAERKEDFDVRVGGLRCSDSGDSEDVINTRWWASDVQYDCTVGDGLPAGRHNVSFRAIAQRNSAYRGYGAARFTGNSKQIDLGSGVVYHVTAHPHVKKLSVHSAGLGGGTLVMISGASFAADPDDNTVTLAGEPCSIISASSTRILCETSPVTLPAIPAPSNNSMTAEEAEEEIPAFTVVAGGRGLSAVLLSGYPRDYHYNPGNSDSRYPNYPTYQGVNSDSIRDPPMWWPYRRYSSLQEGFFVPPISANYSFHVRADDWVRVYLGTTPLEELRDSVVPTRENLFESNPTPVAQTYSYTTSWWSWSQQHSEPMYLEKGKSYPFKMMHGEYGGGAWIDFALRIHGGQEPAARFRRAANQYDGSAVSVSSHAAATQANTVYIAGADAANKDTGAQGESGWPRTVEALSSVHEEQQVRIISSPTREAHELITYGYSGGNFALRTFYGGKVVTSAEVAYGADSNTVRAAYAQGTALAGCSSLWHNRETLYDEAEEVVLGYRYVITFNCWVNPASPLPIPSVIDRGLTVHEDVDVADRQLVASRIQEHSVFVSGSFRLCVACGWKEYMEDLADWKNETQYMADQAGVVVDLENPDFNFTRVGLHNVEERPEEPDAGHFTPFLSYAASWWDVENALQRLPSLSKLNFGGPVDVTVSQGGDHRQGRSYFIVFMLPTGDVPEIEIDDRYLTGPEGWHTTVRTYADGANEPLINPVPADWFRTAVLLPTGPALAQQEHIGAAEVNNETLAVFHGNNIESQNFTGRTLVGLVDVISAGFRASCDHFLAGQPAADLGVSLPLSRSVSAAEMKDAEDEVRAWYENRGGNKLEEIADGELFSSLYAWAEERLDAQTEGTYPRNKLNAFTSNAALRALLRRSDCLFAFSEDLTPTIASAEMESGGTVLESGETLVIRGTGFLPQSGNDGSQVRPGESGYPLLANSSEIIDKTDGNTVTLSFLPTWDDRAASAKKFPSLVVNCNVSSATTREIRCTVPYLVAGTYEVKVSVGRARGDAIPAEGLDGLPLVTYDMLVGEFSPAAGSAVGGTLLAIRGRGFRPYTYTSRLIRNAQGGVASDSLWAPPNVTVGDRPCLVVKSTFRTIYCRTPPAAHIEGAVADLRSTSRWSFAAVIVNATDSAVPDEDSPGFVDGQQDFAYDMTRTPTITSLSPASISPALSGILWIAYDNIGDEGTAAIVAMEKEAGEDVRVEEPGATLEVHDVLLKRTTSDSFDAGEDLEDQLARADLRRLVLSRAVDIRSIERDLLRTLIQYERELRIAMRRRRAVERCLARRNPPRNGCPPMPELPTPPEEAERMPFEDPDEVYYEDAPVTVFVGDRKCAMRFANTTHIKCYLPRGPAQYLPHLPVVPRIVVRSLGRALPSDDSLLEETSQDDSVAIEEVEPDQVIDRGFRVTSIYPTWGSWAGGTKLTVRGVGFAGSKAQDRVELIANVTVNSTAGSTMLMKIECDVESTTETMIICTTRSAFDAVPAESFDGENFNGLVAAFAAEYDDQSATFPTDDRFAEARVRMTVTVVTNQFRSRVDCNDADISNPLERGVNSGPADRVFGSSDACGFTVSTSHTPQLYGAHFEGIEEDTLVLNGTLLGTNAGGNTTITVGAYECDVQGGGVTLDGEGNDLDWVRCAVHDDKAGTVRVKAHVRGYGNANGTAIHTHILRLDGLVLPEDVESFQEGTYNATEAGLPTSSIGGGRIVTIVGYGFDEQGERYRRRRVGALKDLAGGWSEAADVLGLDEAHHLHLHIASSGSMHGLKIPVINATHRTLTVQLPPSIVLDSGLRVGDVSVELKHPHYIAGELGDPALEEDDGHDHGDMRRRMLRELGQVPANPFLEEEEEEGEDNDGAWSMSPSDAVEEDVWELAAAVAGLHDFWTTDVDTEEGVRLHESRAEAIASDPEAQRIMNIRGHEDGVEATVGTIQYPEGERAPIDANHDEEEYVEGEGIVHAPHERVIAYDHFPDHHSTAINTHRRSRVTRKALHHAEAIVREHASPMARERFHKGFRAAHALLDHAEATGDESLLAHIPTPVMAPIHQSHAVEVDREGKTRASLSEDSGAAKSRVHAALARAHLRHVLSKFGAGHLAPRHAPLPLRTDDTRPHPAPEVHHRKLARSFSDAVMRRRLAAPPMPHVYSRDVAVWTPLELTLDDVIGYDSDESVTPYVDESSETEVEKDDLIVISGMGFGISQEDGFEIKIGGAACVVQTWGATQFACLVGETEQGSHYPRVYFPSRGYAVVDSTVVLTVAGQVSGASNADGASVEGGQLVTIIGSGFPTISEAQADAARRAGRDGAVPNHGSNPAVTPSPTPTPYLPQVQMCNTACDVISSSFGELKCRTQGLRTPGDLEANFNRAPAVLQSEGRVIGSWAHGSYPLSNAFDDDLDTLVSQSYSNCYVGLDMGLHTRALVTRIRFFPRYWNADRAEDASVEGSNDGVTWTRIAKVRGRVLKSWNVLDVYDSHPDPFEAEAGAEVLDFSEEPQYRYIRWAGAPGSYCQVNEVQFIGYEFAANNTDGVCPIRVTNPGGNADTSSLRMDQDTTNAQVTYAIADPDTLETSTPIIESISPSNATALGGTTITLMGSNLAGPGGSYGVDDVAVRLAGVPCDVDSVSSTAITCVTRARDKIRPSTVEVVIGSDGEEFGYASDADKTEAIDDRGTIPSGYTSRQLPGGALAQTANVRVRFRYLDKWSELTTWRDRNPPVAGDTVIVPEGQALLVDIPTPSLFLILVQGELVFDRVDDLSIEAEYFLGLGGSIEAGSEDHPHENTLTITLNGDRWDQIELPHVGSKMLAITEASTMGHHHGAGSGHGAGAPVPDHLRAFLDIHGRPRIRSWCRIASDLSPGDTVVTTAEDVDFDSGDRLVISASTVGFSEAEEVVVRERLTDRSFSVVRPIQRPHSAQIFPATQFGHQDADMRAAVGLISRNIVIRGGDSDLSTEQLFGVHTGVFHGGLYRLEHAEVHTCGQGHILGRYCTHAHMVGKGARGSYVENMGIHHSFQRAATIHGVTHYEVRNNVAYEVKGHTFFVEDGAETWNVIEENLVITTRKSFASLKSDLKPASFWMASPLNIWRSNYAAGCVNDGYWFEPPGIPHGPSATSTICPVRWFVGEFWNNSASGNGVHGLRIYPTYLPHEDPCDPSSPPKPQFFYNFTSFRNGGHGIFGKQNGDLHHINAKLLDNGGDDQRWVKFPRTDVVYRPNLPNIDHQLVVADSLGYLAGRPYRGGKVGIMMPQDEFFHARDVMFVGYGNAGAFAGCAKCGSSTDMKQGSYTYRVEGFRFEETLARVRWDPPYKDIFWDLDGSVTGWYKDRVSARQTSEGNKKLPLLFDQGGFLTNYRPYLHYPSQCEHSGSDEVNSTTVTAFNPLVSSSDDSGIRFGNGIVCYPTAAVRRMVMHFPQPQELDWATLRVSGIASHNDAYGDLVMLPKEEYGWVTPLITGKTFELWLRRHVDFSQMEWRFSEWPYVNASSDLRLDSVVVGLNYSYTRHRTETTVGPDTPYERLAPIIVRNRTEAGFDVSRRDGVGLPSTVATLDEIEEESELYAQADDVALSLLTPINLTHDGRLPNPGRGDGLGMTYTNYSRHYYYTLLTGVNNTVPYEHNLGLDTMTLRSDRKQCPPGGCIKPERGDYGPPIDWSDPFGWPGRKVPADGDICNIGPTTHIILDRAEVYCTLLNIEGKLSFKRGADRRVIAKNVFVWGELEIGTTENPFLETAEIVLMGPGDFTEEDEPPPVDDALHLGHKVMMVVGNLTLHGAPLRRTWTRLGESAYAGNTTITLQEPVTTSGSLRGWRVGDQITITPTAYARNNVRDELTERDDFGQKGGGVPELETRTIEAVAADGVTLTLDEPLDFNHFGGWIDVDKEDTDSYTRQGSSLSEAPKRVFLGAAVGLLTRNVRIKGDMSHVDPSAPKQDYGTTLGGTIIVAEVAPGGEDSRVPRDYSDDDQAIPIADPYQGMVDLEYVELRSMGKGNTEFPAIHWMFDILPRTGRARAFRPHGVSNNPIQIVHGCSLTDSYNYGLRAQRTSHLRITDTVIHRSYRYSVYITPGSFNATLDGVLAAGTLRASSDTHNWYVPRASFFVNEVPTAIRRCVSGGSYDAGFHIRLPACAPDPTFSYAAGHAADAVTGRVPFGWLNEENDPFKDNEAHAGRVGVMLLSDRGSWTSKCRQFSSFTAWKQAHIGVLTVDQTANLMLRDLKLFDNHIGMSLNFFRMGTLSTHVMVSRSAVAGSTAASEIDGCAASVSCRAFSFNGINGDRCDSVLGDSVRRAGILTPQFTNRGKTCELDFLPVCRPPTVPERLCSISSGWEKRYGLPGVRHARMVIEDTVFSDFTGATTDPGIPDEVWYDPHLAQGVDGEANRTVSNPAGPLDKFSGSDCGRESRAIVHNPTQVDYAAPTILRRLRWVRTPLQARFRLSMNSRTDGKCRSAGTCDGFQGYFRDADGSTCSTGMNDSMIVYGHPGLVAGEPLCRSIPGWAGFQCGDVDPHTKEKLHLRGIVMENIGASRGHVVLGPVRLWRAAPGNGVQTIGQAANSPTSGNSPPRAMGTEAVLTSGADERSYASHGPIDDGCAKRFFFGQYPALVEPNKETRIAFAATLPGTTRFHFHSNDPNEVVRISLFVQRPNTISVWRGRTKVPSVTDQNRPPISTNVPDGANLFNPQARTIWFLMRGGHPEIPYDIRREPTVALNMSLAVSVEEFYGPKVIKNLATLLSIPESRIKIVDVQAGSTNLVVEIADEEESSADTKDTVEQVKRLVDVAIAVKESITGGNFDVGYPVAALDLGISMPALTEAPQDPDANQTALAEAGMGDAFAGSVVEGDDDFLNITIDSGLDDTVLEEIDDIFETLQREGIKDLSGQTDQDDDKVFKYRAPEEDDDEEPLLTPAMIAGIVVGVAAVAGIVAGLMIYRHRLRNNRYITKKPPSPISRAGPREVEFEGSNPTWARGSMPHTKSMDHTAGTVRAGVLNKEGSGRDLGLGFAKAEGRVHVAPTTVRSRGSNV